MTKTTDTETNLTTCPVPEKNGGTNDEATTHVSTVEEEEETAGTVGAAAAAAVMEADDEGNPEEDDNDEDEEEGEKEEDALFTTIEQEEALVTSLPDQPKDLKAAPKLLQKALEDGQVQASDSEQESEKQRRTDASQVASPTHVHQRVG